MISKNKLLWLTMAILSLFLIFSCNRVKKKYFYVAVADKPSYQVGDTLIYQSDSEKIDSFCLINIAVGYDKYYYNSNTDAYYQTIAFHFNKINQFTPVFIHKYSFYITKRKNDTRFRVTWYGSIGLVFSQDSILNSIMLEDTTYNNVFWMARSAIPPNDTSKIKIIFYDKKSGLIKYELLNNEVWILKR
jgi:hypothetical protein